MKIGRLSKLAMTTFQPRDGSEVDPNFTLARLIASTYDSILRNYARGAKTWGHPFFFRFAHEMNGDWYSWAEGGNGNKRGQYVQAWQHVHDIFVSQGATNATWVWCPNVNLDCSIPLDGLYSGDAYVDWTGFDGYYEQWDTLTRSTYSDLVRIAPGKPIMVGESGYVDEKSAIQALDRLDPVLPLSPGRAERHGFEYYRHGTLSLYAALETRSGQVLGKTAERHTSAEFVAFLQEVVASQPPQRRIHFIADNLSVHKTKAVQQFLAEHPKVTLHYTPTYSSRRGGSKSGFPRFNAISLPAASSPLKATWRASSCAISALTTKGRLPSAGPIATLRAASNEVFTFL